MSMSQAARVPNGLPDGKPLLDAVNLRLLEALGEDPGLSAATLGRRVGMSAPAVRERIGRLEAAGVIRGYRLDVDPAALGLPVTAFVRLRPAPGQLERIADLAVATEQISECHRITGEDCFLIKLHAATVAGLEDVLDLFLKHGQTVSSIVVTSPVPGRPLPIPD